MNASLVQTLKPGPKLLPIIQQHLSESDNGNKPTLDQSLATLEQSLANFDQSFIELDFAKYDDRLKSYTNWPNTEVSKESLAKAGFYYKNFGDVVQCPFCNIEGYHWLAGDDPMKDHRSWSPQCRFVMTSVEPDSPNSRNADTCGLYGVAIHSNSVPEDEIQLEKLGIQKNKGPAHPEKFSYENRLKTFACWPKSIKQTPHDLAEAGFFYVAIGDQTVCFHCGGGLKDWEENDSPWEEHALWFPKCAYLFLKKGPDYIKEVKEKRNPKAPSNNTNSETKETPPKTEEISVKKSEKEDNDDEETRSEKTICKICYKNEVAVVFLPCGHIVACVECSSALKNCAVCRKPLEATVRAFLS